ncbi:MAG: hypothetical protein ACIARR_06595 [Phycisphaerales bacterium JB059]
MIRALLAFVLLLLSPAPVRAQAPADLMGEDDQRVRFSVTWGFDGASMLAERWSPVRFHITSGVQPVSGSIVVTYQQDASQTMRIEAPFATTPGLVVPVELALALPAGCRSVNVRVQDERGRRLLAHTFSRSASDPEDRMPAILPANGIPLLSVGDTGLHTLSPSIIAQDFSQPGRPPPPVLDDDDPWFRGVIFETEPERLPTTWKAYDAVSAVVLHAASLPAIPAPSRDALRRWVRSGGTLVLVADAPDESWRLLTTGPTGRSPLSLAPLIADEPIAPLANLVDPATQIPTRPISLTPLGQRSGWTTRWDRDESGALLAEGPLGLGWMIALAVDPARVPALPTDEQTARLWREILRPTVDRWANEIPAEHWYWGQFGFEPSGASLRQRSAISSILDHTLHAPTPGLGLFILLVACVVLLAILVGPVDAILLKRLRKRQHSWATALAYIALACVPALLAPLILRAGPTAYARARCVDVLPQSLGGDTSHTAISSTFSNASGPVRITNPAPGSWWRPVSALQSYAASGGVGAQFACTQDAAPTPDGLVRQNVPLTDRANAQRLWTLRSLMDEGANLPAPLGATDPDTRRLRVTGLPDQARVLFAFLVYADPAPDPDGADHRRYVLLPNTPIRSGLYEAPIPPPDAALPEPPTGWAPIDLPRDQPWRWRQFARRYSPIQFTHLPGAWERSRAIDAHLDAGASALLMLQLEHEAPDASLGVRADTHALELYRILVPLPETSP